MNLKMNQLSREGKAWPMLLDLKENECRNALRELELRAYSDVVSVLRAQGELTKEKRKILNDLQSLFCISTERHKAEVRRAVNDEMLNTLAETLAGPNSGIEWSIEGRRLISLMPRLPPQVSYTALATHMAQKYCGINAKKVKPCQTANFGKMEDFGAESDVTDSEEETDGLRFITSDMIPEKFNQTHSSYTTLPLSKARLAQEEQLKVSTAPPEPGSPSSVSSVDSSSLSPLPASQHSVKTSTAQILEKRKRKRSFSLDQALSQSSSVPVSGSSMITSPHETQTTTSRAPSLGNSMKLGTQSISRSSISSSAPSTQAPHAMAHAQKVILVSTSGSNSGSSPGIFPRSISVPVLKNSQTSSLPPSNALLKGHTAPAHSGVCPPLSSSLHSVSTSNAIVTSSQHSSNIVSSAVISNTAAAAAQSTSTSSAGLSPLAFVRSVRPRLPPSGNISSVQPISGMPKTAQRQRSNSLVMQQSENLRGASSSPLPPTISQCSSRILNRSTSALPTQVPQVSQGVYIVSTNAGTITFVTRTICSVAVSAPRVVTMNPSTTSRPSVLRPTSSIVSLSHSHKKTSLIPPKKSIQTVRVTSQAAHALNARTLHQNSSLGGSTKAMVANRGLTGTVVTSSPKIGTSKITGLMGIGAKSSNVIVVHKGTIPPSQVRNTATIGGIKGGSFKDMTKSKSTGITQQITHISAQGSNVKSSPSLSVSGQSGQLALKSTTTNKPSIFHRSNFTPSQSLGNFTAAASSRVASPLVSTSIMGSGVITVNASGNSLHVASQKECMSSKSPSIISTTNVVMMSASSQQKELAEQQQQQSVSSSFNLSSISASSSLPPKLRAPSPSRVSPKLMTLAHSLKVSKQSQKESPGLVETPSDKDDEEEDMSDDGLDDSENFNTSSIFMDEKEDAESANEWLKFGLDETTTTDDDSEVDKKSRITEVATKEKIVLHGQKSSMSERVKPQVTTMFSAGSSSGCLKKGNSSITSTVISKVDEPKVKSLEVRDESNLSEREVKGLVEKAVDVLKVGDKDQARTLLTQAGFELVQTYNEKIGADSFSISKMGDVRMSSRPKASIKLSEEEMPSTPSRGDGDMSGTEEADSSLGSIVGDLDPATGLFYSPSGDNSSDSASLMSPGSPSLKNYGTSIIAERLSDDNSDLNESSDDR